MSGCAKSILFQRMPLAGILLFTVLLVSLLFAGCTSEDSKPETDDSPAQNNNNASNNEWTNVGNYEWIVEPKFDYRDIYYIGTFQSELRIINPKTGELTGEIASPVGGYVNEELAYDEERKIWGIPGEYAELTTFSSLSEATANYTGTLFFVHKIKLASDEIGPVYSTGLPHETYESINKYALANRNGLVTDFLFDRCDMKKPRSKTPAVMQEGKWGFIDETGKIVIAFEFEDAISIDDETAFVKKNGLWGIIRKGGSN
jgi:hypothetical protein